MGRPPGSKNKPKEMSDMTVLPVTGKRSRRVTEKARSSGAHASITDEDSDDDPKEASGTGIRKLLWDNNQLWTSLIIDYLTDNADFRRKLFSDSTREAKIAGRRKNQGKDGKAQMHAVLANYVFAENIDEKLAKQYAIRPTQFVKSVGQHLSRLKKTYGVHVRELGKTGAGLKSSEITPGSDIANKIDAIKEDFPFWDDLHAFWSELPNYNPLWVSNGEAGTRRNVDWVLSSETNPQLVPEDEEEEEEEEEDEKVEGSQNSGIEVADFDSTFLNDIAPPSPPTPRRSPRVAKQKAAAIIISPLIRKTATGSKFPTRTKTLSTIKSKKESIADFRELEAAELEQMAHRDKDRHDEKLAMYKLEHARFASKEKRREKEIDERRKVREEEQEERRKIREEERDEKRAIHRQEIEMEKHRQEFELRKLEMRYKYEGSGGSSVGTSSVAIDEPSLFTTSWNNFPGTF